jgi:hypothetical protein
LKLTCKNAGGVCARTNQKHVVLSGIDPITTQLNTSKAQADPLKLARIIADTIYNTVDGLAFEALTNKWIR